jgi:hypothetical protein
MEENLKENYSKSNLSQTLVCRAIERCNMAWMQLQE